MTKHVHLVPIDAEFARVADAEPGGVLLRYRVHLGACEGLVREAVQQTLAMKGVAPPWGGYLAFDETTRLAVGTCAFKGAPTTDRAVEIAYFTFPPFEGQGYATAMAARLLELAWGATRVSQVLAHTRPERDASSRILEKLGFELVGEIELPDDGAVWLWRRYRPGTLRTAPVLPSPA